MKDDFRFLAKFFDLIIHPKRDIPWKEFICVTSTNNKLLDVGGGTGRVAKFLKDCFKTIVIYDVSLPMLQQLKDGENKIVRICGEIETIAFSEESFEMAIMVDTLHHIKNQNLAVNKILQVLKPNGIFILEEPDIRKFPVKLIALLEKALLMRSHFLKPNEIEKWIDRDRFTLRYFEEGSNFFFVIQKKKF